MFETTWIPQKTFDEMAACARHHGWIDQLGVVCTMTSLLI
jgi:hypothetical protein